jgi:hypothetical protein
LDKAGEDGLDFLLTHFQGQELIWPRTISTRTTEKRQILVSNREEALARFKQANWQDCRISAYPSYVGLRKRKGIDRYRHKQAPDFIFIDLDRATFKTEAAHSTALSKTLENIKQRLGNNSNPTILWSGNGYHIYLPVSAFVFEDQEVFAKFLHMDPSRKFIQFAESTLSDNKADKAHNITISLRNCMLRIPGSINSKNGQTVRLLSRWNDYRPPIKPLLEDFYIHLSALRIKELTDGKTASSIRNESYRESISRYMRFKVKH